MMLRQSPRRLPSACSTRAPKGAVDWLVRFLASGAYVGYAPIAPGSVGSLLGLLLARFAWAPAWDHRPVVFIICFAAGFALACPIADSAEKAFGRHDCSRIVIDEIFGMTAAMFLNPVSWAWLAVGFALFRLLDIIKPWPAARFDRMQGGAGVMLDDLACGIYVNLALQLLQRII